MSKKTNKVAVQSAGACIHGQENTRRLGLGVQPKFDVRNPPSTYRYASSLPVFLDKYSARKFDENASKRMAQL